MSGLLICRQCAGSVASTAATCPTCNATITKRDLSVLGLVLVVGAGLCVALGGVLGLPCAGVLLVAVLLFGHTKVVRRSAVRVFTSSDRDRLGVPLDRTAKRLPQSLVPYAVLLVLVAACASFLFYPRTPRDGAPPPAAPAESDSEVRPP